MKSFNKLWWQGLIIVGLPTIFVLSMVLMIVIKGTKPKTVEVKETVEQLQDTVKIEVIKRVIVKDTVYIRVPNPKQQTTQVKDTL
jgi:hypothetical protein